jgi:muramidase (phage lysozyme)
MEKKTFRVASGVCPVCASNNISYNNHEMNDYLMTFYGTCRECNTNILEEYSLVYNGTMNTDTTEYFDNGDEVEIK